MTTSGRASCGLVCHGSAGRFVQAVNGAAAVSWWASRRASAGRTAAATVSHVVVEVRRLLHGRDVLGRGGGGDRDLAGRADQRGRRVEEGGPGQLSGAVLVGRGGQPVLQLRQREPGHGREPGGPGRLRRVGRDAPGRARGEEPAQRRLVGGAEARAAEQGDLIVQQPGECRPAPRAAA